MASLEFDLAEKIWQEATTTDDKRRAMELFALACKNGDGESCLRLYEIKDEGKYRYLLDDGVSDRILHVYDAMDLGYIPAFLAAYPVAGDETYTNLVYLSIALSLAHKSSNHLYGEFQTAFVENTKDFPSDFLPEILKKGSSWSPGDGFTCAYSSELDEKELLHPERISNDEISKSHFLYPDWSTIRIYLSILPGSEEYFSNSDNQMEISAKKGNGQAIYHLLGKQNYDGEESLIRAGECGSPDALEDLVSRIVFSDLFEGFVNSDRSINHDTSKTKCALFCMLYLYSVYERLGLLKYIDGFTVQTNVLSISTRSGYRPTEISLKNLKYDYCSRSLVTSVNAKVAEWNIGCRFHREFYESLQFIDGD